MKQQIIYNNIIRLVIVELLFQLMAGYIVGNVMIQINYEYNIALGHPESIIIRVRASKGEVVLF